MINTTGNNSGLQSIVRIHSTERPNTSGFQARKRKLSTQVRGSVVYSMMDLDSHMDTIVCGSNCIVMNLTGKECDIATYTDA